MAPPLVLSVVTADRCDAVRRFLRAVLAVELPCLADATAQGVPPAEASEFLLRLEYAGEVAAGRWQPQARLGYQRLLERSASSEPAVAVTRCAPVTRQLETMALSERPREKALSSGIEALSDIELIALVLRTGRPQEGVLEAAGRLLRERDGLAGLARCSAGDLAARSGIGPARAAQLAAAFEIGRRIAKATLRERPVVRTAEAVAALLAPLSASLGHEELWCLALDAQSRVIGEPRVVSKGDVDGTDAGPRAFFRMALSAGATACIAVHNHPGGDPTPSAQDRAVTQRLAEAGRTLDVPLVDHVVLAAGGRWASLRSLDPGCFR